jgi:serine/threonine protein kinase
MPFHHDSAIVDHESILSEGAGGRSVTADGRALIRHVGAGESKVTPDDSGWDWAARGSSHVSFLKSEDVPLKQGRFLGYGVNGGVYETACNSQAVAWKRIFCRSGILQRHLKEIEIIKKLRHRHIIELVGTYTHGPFLGLLLWPVAVCDLATFLVDVDTLIGGSAGQTEDSEVDWEAIGSRMSALDLDITTAWRRDSNPAHPWLLRSLGCITNAIVYLHNRHIRHKDLKPSNILLYQSGLRITDFGTSTDFSSLTHSSSEGDERGTPKYFAPEVAAYQSHGRSADIFSLGCIFLEILALKAGYSLADLKRLRTANDQSFQANRNYIYKWFDVVCADVFEQHLLGVARYMIHPIPEKRPTAPEIDTYIKLLDGFKGWGLDSNTNRDTVSCLYGQCCRQIVTHIANDIHLNKSQTITMPLIIGNTALLEAPDSDIYSVKLGLYSPMEHIISAVHIFGVSINISFKDIIKPWSEKVRRLIHM